MDTSGTLLIYRLLSILIICLMTSLSCHVVSLEKFSRRTFAKVLLVMGATLAVNVNFLSQDSPYKFLLASVSVFLSYLWAYRFTGRKLVLRSFVLLSVQFGADILSGLLILQLFDPRTVEGMRYMTIPETLLLQCISGLGMVLLAMAYRLFMRYARRISPAVGYLVRPLSLLLIIIFIFYFTLRSAPEGDEVTRFFSMLPSFVLMMLLLLIGTTYIVQDIRFYQQTQENKRLQQEKQLQSQILLQTRTFRHNIANMLYGFQGVLSSGDTAAMEEYYQSMVKACQMVNNENITAIKRISSPAISSLLVNKVLSAHEQGIPFLISVDENIPGPFLHETDSTQIIGILLDNAIEAAAASSAPHVSMEIRKKGRAYTLLIRNTYAGDPPVFSEHTPSTKESHEGLGLQSLHRLLKKYPYVLFNIYTNGRYVEAVLNIE